MKELNKDDFDKKVLKAEGKILVDFNAEWCGPCRMLKPILDDLAKDYKIYSVNVDKNRDLTFTYDIMSIPCLLLFKDGKIVSRGSGMMAKDDIIKMMEDD